MEPEIIGLRSIYVCTRPLPDSYHARTGHTLRQDRSKVFQQLSKTKEYSEKNDMKINTKKTNLMIFNPCRSKDFHPNFNIDDITLDVVEKTRLLGVHLRSDLKWHDNTSNMVKKAYSKLWMLRRLRTLGADVQDLVDIYCKQVRCHLEFAVPVWQGAITKFERTTIERVQRCALRIILGDGYRNYQNALEILNLEDLESRNVKLCLNFGLKAARHPKHSQWFKERLNHTTRSNMRYYPAFASNKRFENSPIAYITKLLNDHFMKSK